MAYFLRFFARLAELDQAMKIDYIVHRAGTNSTLPPVVTVGALVKYCSVNRAETNSTQPPVVTDGAPDEQFKIYLNLIHFSLFNIKHELQLLI